MQVSSAQAPLDSTVALVAIVACMAALAYAGVFLSSGPPHTLLGLACLSSVVICLLSFWIRREYDIFEPMGYILIFTIVAMPLRHLYLMMLEPGQGEVLKLTNRQPAAFFIPAALMVNIALAGLVCGYLCTTYRLKLERIGLVRSMSWRTKLYWPVTMALVGISVIAFIKIISLTGFQFSDDVARLSRKRALPSDVAAGYLMWAVALARYAFLITIAYLLSCRGRVTLTGGLALLVIAAVAMGPAFFSSSRTGILETAVVGLAVYTYMGGRLNVKVTLLMVPVLGIISIIGMFRGRSGGWTGWGDVFDPLGLLATLAGAFNYGGFVATAHVMDAFGPEDFTFGSTLTFWTYAWIPRSIWPEKPREVGYLLLSLLEFRGDVDTRRGGGAAAGLPAEIYLSFGPYLVPFAMFIFGAFLRAVYNSLRPLAQTSPVAAVLCATSSFALAQAYGYGLSRGMIMAGREGIAVIVVFLLLLRWPANRSPGEERLRA